MIFLRLVKHIKKFGNLSFWDKLNALRVLCWRLKGQVFHRPFFGAYGLGTFIARPTLITCPHRIFLGKKVGIRQGARLEVIQPSAGIIPTLQIGDNVNIEQNVHIVCHRKVQIGANVSITANCAIVDVTHPIDPSVTCDKIGGKILDEDSWVIIEDGVFIGIGTVILPNVRIGKGAMIGANSVVTKDIPQYSIAAGAPARVLRTYRMEDSEGKEGL